MDRAERPERLRARMADSIIGRMPIGYALHEVVLNERGEPTDYRFLDLNDGFTALTGLVPATTLGRTVREVLPGIEEEWIQRYGRVALTGEVDRFDHFAAPLGRHYAVTAYRPEPMQFVVLFTDITDEREELRVVKESASYFQAIVESSAVGVYVLQEGRIVYTDPKFRELVEAVDADPAHALGGIHAEDRDELLRKLCQPPMDAIATVRFRLSSDPTRHRALSVTGGPVELGGSTAFMGVVVDATNQDRLEEQLRHAQKMESVGRLAGGVAHDFNNILTAIGGHARLLREDCSDAQMFAGLDEIIAAADRATTLTRQLLAVSRRQVVRPEPLNLADLVHDLYGMTRRLLPEHIQIQVRATAPAWVKADRGSMEQVLMNLVVNARDAMPRGGRVVIETGTGELDEDYARAHADVEPGRYAWLAVRDTGMGIDVSVRDRIFEPFFTTKGHGIGTGLGLSTVYGIVRQAGGHVWLYSEEGAGTTFKVYLPLREAPGEREQADAGVPTIVEPSSTNGSETVLLVEDDKAVRRMMRDALRRRGYTVLEAWSAEEALSIAREGFAAIDLLVTDVVLPGMDGPTLAEALRASRPDLRVLLASGYAENAITQDGALRYDMHFLEKPFDPTALGAAVRRALDT